MARAANILMPSPFTGQASVKSRLKAWWAPGSKRRPTEELT
ncbi:hypothetical protein AVEN_153151-1, partial [Araneus ventricosus]